MNNFLDVASLESWQLWLIAIIGFLVAILGFRIKKVAFFIIWFVLGFLLMDYFMPNIENAMPMIRDSMLWRMLIPLGGGLLVALMGFTIEKICLGGICFALVIMTTAQYFGTEIQTMAIGAIVGVIAAGASSMLTKPATIIATAVAGGYMLTISLTTLFSEMNAEVAYWPMIIGIGVLGSIIQFVTTRRE